eukprot:gene20049-biopygen6480
MPDRQIRFQVDSGREHLPCDEVDTVIWVATPSVHFRCEILEATDQARFELSMKLMIPRSAQNHHRKGKVRQSRRGREGGILGFGGCSRFLTAVSEHRSKFCERSAKHLSMRPCHGTLPWRARYSGVTRTKCITSASSQGLSRRMIT